MRAQGKNCENTTNVLQHTCSSVTQNSPLHVTTAAVVLAWDSHYANKKCRGQDGFLIMLLKDRTFHEHCSFLSNESCRCKQFSLFWNLYLQTHPFTLLFSSSTNTVNAYWKITRFLPVVTLSLTPFFSNGFLDGRRKQGNISYKSYSNWLQNSYLIDSDAKLSSQSCVLIPGKKINL